MSQATQKQLRCAANSFFSDLASCTPSLLLLTHFSTTHPVVIQHAPASCPRANTFRLTGLNAIRSYFDLLATHYSRDDMQMHAVRENVETRQVVINASIKWIWKTSGRSWQEDFICTLEYDEHLKIVSFFVDTQSPPATCVMRAIDVSSPDKSTALENSTVPSICSEAHSGAPIFPF